MGVARGIGRALRQRQEWDRQSRHERLQRDQLRRSDDREARDEERQAIQDALRREQHDWQRGAVQRQEEEYRRKRLGESEEDAERRKFRFIAEVEDLESPSQPLGTIGAPTVADDAKAKARQALIKKYGRKKWDAFDFSDDGGIEFSQGGKPVGRISGGERNAVREALRQQAEEADLAQEAKRLANENLRANIDKNKAATANIGNQPEQAAQEKQEKDIKSLQNQIDAFDRQIADAEDEINDATNTGVLPKTRLDVLKRQREKAQTRLDRLSPAPAQPELNEEEIAAFRATEEKAGRALTPEEKQKLIERIVARRQRS